MNASRTLLTGPCLALLALAFTACSPQPSAIDYGKDACHFCSMAIVEKQYGAEMVTQRGKVYKYDSIECLLGDLKRRDPDTIAMELVNTYDTPILLQEASGRVYLISEALPSPMGANLSAFDTEATATRVHQEKGGTLYDLSLIHI